MAESAVTLPLADQTIAVTGAASGIGAACCRRLKLAGATVVGMDRQAPNDIPMDRFIEFDQGQPEDIERAAQEVGPAHGLLNVAGVAPGPRFDPSAVLRINFFGVRHLTRQLQSTLVDGAAIVNMGSGAGAGWMANLDLLRVLLDVQNRADLDSVIQSQNIINEGTGNTSAYPLSKQLLSVWTMQMAAELRPRKIRVNTVAPAAVDTPILGDFLTSFGAEAAGRMQAFGAGSPDSVAAVAVWLLGADASRISGATLPVDAGAIAAGTIAKLNLSE